MQGQTFIFFGIVGSGKGTQVKLLQDYLKEKDNKESVYLSPGAEYRKLMAAGTYVGNMITESMNRGELQPDFLTNSIMTNLLISSLDDNKHIFADGYPRTIVQSEIFEQMMTFFKRNDVKIIYIEVGKEEAMKRNLSRGRDDDTPDGIEKRFDEYINKVVPAMEYFKSKNGYELYTINGEQPVEKVHTDILTALKL